MTLQILALLIVVVSFTALVAWVYAPRNADRMNEASRLALDEDVLPQTGSRKTDGETQ